MSTASLAGLVPLILDKPTSLDKRADRERVEDGLSGAGVEAPVDMPPDLLKDLPRSLREHDFSITPVVGHTRDRRKLVSLNGRASYGVAVDVGTTNIVASLFDMRGGQKLGLYENENPQIAAGADVLSRAHLAMAGKGDDLHNLLMRGVNETLQGLCRAHGIGCKDVHAAVFAGNTIMSHFLLGLPVDTIPVEPYIPVVNRMDFTEPREIGLDIHRHGIVYIFPNTGSYVGGDIVSGILSTGLHKMKKTSMLVDVGTNAEIVLGCEDWLMVGAGAAGPALEGGVSGIGMRAAEGAIYGVGIEKKGEGGVEVKLRTLGDKEPKGLCGSGMIELIAELYRSGMIDPQGRLTGISGRIREIDGRRAFVVYESGDRILAMKDTDIENFLRSKAAMFASLYVMVKSVGLGFRE
ncbi:MAG TPA: ASKHA domain-containing protein, partial [Dissulfurispiraceae bacterium]